MVRIRRVSAVGLALLVVPLAPLGLAMPVHADIVSIPSPGGPANLTGRLVSGAPFLNWDPVDGARSYEVHDNGAIAADTTATTFTDTTAPLGVDTYYVTAVFGDGSQSDPSDSATVTVPNNPVFTSLNSTDANERVSFDFKVTVASTPLAALSETGLLPAGVTFTDNGDGSGELSGVPAVGSGGNYNIVFNADNGGDSIVTQSFVLNVGSIVSAPVFVSAASDTQAWSEPFTFTVQTNGLPAPTITKGGSLPPGITFVDNGDGTATIAGNPASDSDIGAFPVTLNATSPLGSASQVFTLAITKAPVIAPIANETTSIGQAVSVPLKVASVPPVTVTQTGLPAGFSVIENADGSQVIQGTALRGEGGAYAVMLTATNSAGSSSQMFTLQINEVPAIVSPAGTSVASGSAFTFQLIATGYPKPLFTESGRLPTGVTFDNSNGVLSGTPVTGSAGTYPIAVAAKNSSGTATQNFILMVS